MDVKESYISDISIHDIADRPRADLVDEIARLRREINNLKNVEQTRAALSRVVYHDLKAPINSIISCIDVVFEGTVGPLAQQQKDFLRRAENGLFRLSSFVERLMELCKIEGTLFDQKPDDLLIEEILIPVIESYKDRADSKEITIDLDTGRGIPSIRADRTSLEHIFHNLVSNAVKYTPEGGRVTVSAGNTADEITVAVRDTGVGIDAADIQNIFKPFFRCKNAASMDQKGTGLGLSITKMIADSCGGWITVESEPGKGSVFTFHFPLKHTVSSPGAEEHPATPEQKPHPGIGALAHSFREIVRLDTTVRDLEQANAEITRLNRHYLEMLGFVTHELTHPMGIIKGYLIMFQDGSLGPCTEEQRETIESMQRNVEHVINMSKKYLHAAKIESGELDVRKRNIRIFYEIISPIIKAEKRNLEINQMTIDIEDRDRVRVTEVHADRVLLHIVFNNLVQNALRYGRRGSAITIGCRMVTDCVRLHVRNEGPGIPADKLEAVFEKFRRLERDAASRVKGTGLGLYNSKIIIEKHGGKIWVESVEGEYADFIFTLPLNPAK